ncbi:MAG: anthranilate phosphoribosyltransferase, partial [Brevundimonas sp.]
AKRAWTVNGQGLDELTTTGPTEVAEWKDGKVTRFSVTPEDAGLPRATLADIQGGDAEVNAAALRALLNGEKGAYRDIVLMNAAAALIVSDKAETLKQGVEIAAAVIDDGRALAALDALVRASHTPVETEV